MLFILCLKFYVVCEFPVIPNLVFVCFTSYIYQSPLCVYTLIHLQELQRHRCWCRNLIHGSRRLNDSTISSRIKFFSSSFAFKGTKCTVCVPPHSPEDIVIPTRQTFPLFYIILNNKSCNNGSLRKVDDSGSINIFLIKILKWKKPSFPTMIVTFCYIISIYMFALLSSCKRSICIVQDFVAEYHLD